MRYREIRTLRCFRLLAKPPFVVSFPSVWYEVLIASPLVSITILAVTGVAAESPASQTGAKEEPPIFASAPASPSASALPLARPRIFSPAAADQLTAATPKIEAVPPANPAEPAPDLRETDKPRNTIIRLPPYIVQEKKPLVLKERELLTPKARLEVALKKYPGLHFGSFWIFSNNGVALAMLAEEERLERKREFVAGAQLTEEGSGTLRFPLSLALVKCLPVEQVGASVPRHGDEQVIVGTALFLRFEHADVTFDPSTVAHQVAVPAPSELRRV